MIEIAHPSKVEVRPSEGKGMGVFAKEPINAWEVIEDCHLIFLPNTPNDNPMTWLLEDYRFNYPARQIEWTHQVIPLGFGSIYNHSNEWNTEWIAHPTISTMFRFRAIRDISIGEECCTYYGNVEFP